MGSYWLVQAAVCYVGWPLLVWDFDPRSFWLSPRYVSAMAGVLLVLMFLQAWMVTPLAARRSVVGLPTLRSEIIATSAALGGLAAYGSLWVLLGIVPLMRLELTHDLALLVTGGVFLLACAASGGVMWTGRVGDVVWLRLKSLVLGLAAAHMVLGVIAGVLALIPVEGGERMPLSASVLSGAMLFIAQWLIFSVIVDVATDRGRGDGGRLLLALTVAAAVGVVVLFPLDLVVRPRDKWYLDSGTLWGVTLCGSAALLLGGPAIWGAVLAAERKAKKSCCGSCGYDMSGCRGAADCPECGAAWTSRAHVVAAIVGAMEADLDRAALGSAEGERVEVGGGGEQA